VRTTHYTGPSEQARELASGELPRTHLLKTLAERKHHLIVVDDELVTVEHTERAEHRPGPGGTA
jgi:hypothetical protein